MKRKKGMVDTDAVAAASGALATARAEMLEVMGEIIPALWKTVAGSTVLRTVEHPEPRDNFQRWVYERNGRYNGYVGESEFTWLTPIGEAFFGGEIIRSNAVQNRILFALGQWPAVGSVGVEFGSNEVGFDRRRWKAGSWSHDDIGGAWRDAAAAALAAMAPLCSSLRGWIYTAQKPWDWISYNEDGEELDEVTNEVQPQTVGDGVGWGYFMREEIAGIWPLTSPDDEVKLWDADAHEQNASRAAAMAIMGGFAAMTFGEAVQANVRLWRDGSQTEKRGI